MSYEISRKVLKDENKLLKKLHGVASGHALGATSTEKLIAEGWANSFRKLHDMNKDSLEKNDTIYEEIFEGEKDLLEKMRDVAKGHQSSFAASWVSLFEEDLAIVVALLKP